MGIGDKSILREHNLDTYNQAKCELEKYGKVAVVQPTGTGKTYIMMQLLQDYSNMTKLVIAPKKQALGIMEENEHWEKDNTITMTYAYICKNIDNLKDIIFNKYDIGLIVLDEFHRAGAKIWQQAVKAIVDNYRDSLLLGFTATPVRYLDDCRDMVAELFDGHSVGNITLNDAIINGIIAKPTYIMGMHSIDKDLKLREEYATGNKPWQVRLRQEITNYRDSWVAGNCVGNMMHKYLHNTDGNKHIVFAESVNSIYERMDEIKNWFECAYPNKTVNVITVHSYLSKNDVDKNIDAFVNGREDEIHILVSVNMFNESYHIDGVQSVTLLRHTDSVILYLQQIGRVLAHGGKTPIIFDLVDNITQLNFQGTAGKYMLGNSVLNNGLELDVYDETTDFKNILDTIDRSGKAEWIVQFKRMIAELEKPGIYHVLQFEDVQLRDWAKAQIKLHHEESLSTYHSNLMLNHSELLGFSWFILKTAGEEWFNTIELVKENISTFSNYNWDNNKVLTKWILKTNLMYIRNEIPLKAIDYLNSQGIYLNCRNDKKYLMALLNKSNPNSTWLSTFKGIKYDSSTGKLIRADKGIITVIGLDRQLGYGKKYIRWSKSQTEDAIAYWIWHNIRSELQLEKMQLCV